jgi:hypothetical protein
MGRRRQRQRGHITRQSWENGFIERFNARLRDELLDGEGFYSLKEARIVIESWRRHYNTERPQGSSGYKPPAPEAFVSAFAVRVPAPTPTSSSASAGFEADNALPLRLDPSLGADHHH